MHCLPSNCQWKRQSARRRALTFSHSVSRSRILARCFSNDLSYASSDFIGSTVSGSDCIAPTSSVSFRNFKFGDLISLVKAYSGAAVTTYTVWPYSIRCLQISTTRVACPRPGYERAGETGRRKAKTVTKIGRWIGLFRIHPSSCTSVRV